MKLDFYLFCHHLMRIDIAGEFMQIRLQNDYKENVKFFQGRGKSIELFFE